MNETMIEKLVEMGAARWTKAGKDRLYLNEAAETLMGLKVSRYNSGSVSYAAIDGEKISNAEAKRILFSISKAYVDVTTGKVYGVERDEDREAIEEAIEALKAE